MHYCYVLSKVYIDRVLHWVIITMFYSRGHTLLGEFTSYDSYWVDISDIRRVIIDGGGRMHTGSFIVFYYVR